jgi:hypothetical protein
MTAIFATAAFAIWLAASGSSRHDPDRHHVSSHSIKETAATTTAMKISA